MVNLDILNEDRITSPSFTSIFAVHTMPNSPNRRAEKA
jgi:hypothetical protein